LEEPNPTKAGIDHPSPPAICGELRECGLEIAHIHRFDRGYIVAVRNNGRLARFANKDTLKHGSRFGDERDVLPHVPIDLDGKRQ
jgi:hypothetical protein